jgi:hypothetical protein
MISPGKVSRASSGSDAPGAPRNPNEPEPVPNPNEPKPAGARTNPSLAGIKGRAASEDLDEIVSDRLPEPWLHVFANDDTGVAAEQIAELD